MYAMFARYYDALTDNVDYSGRARYFDEILRREGNPSGLLLDVGCGTGSLSFALAELGYDVIGADPSMEMLSAAMCKRGETGRNVLFLHQPMEELDLYGTVGNAICALDTVNHIADEDTLAAGFARVSLFLEPGGLFLFDVNTAHKHREVLAENVYVYDREEVFCVWQNRYNPVDGSVDITLDFFAPEGERYRRETEAFTEQLYADETLRRLIRRAGLELLQVYEGDTREPVGPRSQRAVYVTRKL